MKQQIIRGMQNQTESTLKEKSPEDSPWNIPLVDFPGKGSSSKVPVDDSLSENSPYTGYPRH